MSNETRRKEELAYLVEIRTGRVFQLNPDRTTIGSAPENDVQIKANPSVSRLHASIKMVDGRWMLVDENSRHGTGVNNRVVSAPQELSPNDRLWFCSSQALFLIGDAR